MITLCTSWTGQVLNLHNFEYRYLIDLSHKVWLATSNLFDGICMHVRVDDCVMDIQELLDYDTTISQKGSITSMNAVHGNIFYETSWETK